MQTSVPNIYAAGDCAEAWDDASGRTVVSAIQPNAVQQGRCAGMNMSGRPVQMVDVPQINVLDTLGLISTSFGRWDGVAGGDHAELLDVPGHDETEARRSELAALDASLAGMTTR